jgi:hypothetical protein
MNGDCEREVEKSACEWQQRRWEVAAAAAAAAVAAAAEPTF